MHVLNISFDSLKVYVVLYRNLNVVTKNPLSLEYRSGHQCEKLSFHGIKGQFQIIVMALVVFFFHINTTHRKSNKIPPVWRLLDL